MIIEHLYLTDLGMRNGKPYYIFVKKEDNIVEADEVIVNVEGVV